MALKYTCLPSWTKLFPTLDVECTVQCLELRVDNLCLQIRLDEILYFLKCALRTTLFLWWRIRIIRAALIWALYIRIINHGMMFDYSINLLQGIMNGLCQIALDFEDLLAAGYLANFDWLIWYWKLILFRGCFVNSIVVICEHWRFVHDGMDRVPFFIGLLTE